MIVKRNEGENALFANKNYAPDDRIRKLEGPIVDQPTRTSIEIRKNVHVEDIFGIYMNHSFIPNCKIFNGEIVALKNIDDGDELTFNYNVSETKMSSPFIDSKTGEKVEGRDS